MGGAFSEELRGVAGVDAAANLEAAGESPQGLERGRFISRPEQDNMPASQRVASVKLRVPGAGALRNIIRPHLGRVIAHRPPDDLLYFAFMQVDARTEHAGSIGRK